MSRIKNESQELRILASFDKMCKNDYNPNG